MLNEREMSYRTHSAKDANVPMTNYGVAIAHMNGILKRSLAPFPDALKELDAKVKRPVNMFAYIFGSISAMIMGCGMSLVMTDIGTQLGMTETMVPGIVIGVVGILLAILNYPIYKSILASRKKKYADKIIALSDQLMKG